MAVRSGFERKQNGSEKREDFACVDGWDRNAPEPLLIPGNEVIDSELQRGRSLDSVFEIGHGKDKSLAEIDLLYRNDVQDTKEIGNGCGCCLSIPCTRNDIMDGRERVAGHESSGFPTFDLRKEMSRRVRPWIPLEQDIQKHVDVHEELHVPYFSRRCRR